MPKKVSLELLGMLKFFREALGDGVFGAGLVARIEHQRFLVLGKEHAVDGGVVGIRGIHADRGQRCRFKGIVHVTETGAERHASQPAAVEGAEAELFDVGHVDGNVP